MYKQSVVQGMHQTILDLEEENSVLRAEVEQLKSTFASEMWEDHERELAAKDAEIERLKGEVSRIGKCLELAHEQRVLNARVANDLRSRLEEAVEPGSGEARFLAASVRSAWEGDSNDYDPSEGFLDELVAKLRGEE